MAEGKVKFGLTLPNRGVIIGATTVAEMLEMAADGRVGGWDSVWVGDPSSPSRALMRWYCWARSPRAPGACASDPHASPAPRCAMR